MRIEEKEKKISNCNIKSNSFNKNILFNKLYKYSEFLTKKWYV